LEIPPWIKALIYLSALGVLSCEYFGSSRRKEIETSPSDAQAVLLSRKIQHLEAQNRDLVVSRDKAEAANVSKSNFLANMSHELRTPLNAIIGYSELLQEVAQEFSVEDDMAPDLKKINSAGRQLLEIINDILDLSKIEAGKMELFPQNMGVEELLEELLNTIQPMADTNGNRFEIIKSSSLGSMWVDRARFRQILLNLLSNACKFTRSGTVSLEIERELRQAEDWFLFRVRDTGIGLSSDQMGRLFQNFSQAEPTIQKNFGGTGLGLAISQCFCQMMGGKISVESELNRGSTFTVEIPANTRSLKISADEPPVAVPSSTPSNKILVIDDDPMMRDWMERTFSPRGFEVWIAEDGETGLRLARELRPAVITLDVIMPGMDGWELLTHIKADPTTSQIPVIIISMLDEQNRGFALGAAEYIMKPVDKDRLQFLLKKYRCNSPQTPVLIVEDDPVAREVLRRRLEEFECDVAEAHDGRGALEHVARRQPSLIFLDLMMPVMDGFEFLEKFRKNSAWKSIPVVVVTAKELTPEDRRRLNGSVQKLLQKGDYTREDLFREVHNQVQMHLPTLSSN